MNNKIDLEPLVDDFIDVSFMVNMEEELYFFLCPQLRSLQYEDFFQITIHITEQFYEQQN